MIELGLFVKHRDLVDVWRSQNPQVVTCTWHKPDGTVSSRLDRFYAPRKFPRSRCSIISCPLSDHDAVVLRLQLPESFHVEKGLWRLNTEIVKEQNFKEQFLEKYRGWQSLKPAFPNALVWWDERGSPGGLLVWYRQGPPESKNNSLGSNLSVGELWTAVAAMKKGKSPGPDGLPAEFYRTFWEVLGGDLRDVFATAFQLNYMSQTQRVGNIVLLPKSGDPLDPRNRRPITLLNVDYKILAKALANRLSDVMPDIVGPLQTCAVRGKCIQHNLWLMRDLIEFVKVRDLPCALVSLDQEKAFDMVDHDFLFRTLESFGLNSVYSETLSTSLDRCFGFRPFNVPGGARVKCVQYADDVTCIVSDLASFKPLSKVLTTFQEATGARLNKSKTKGLRLGGWRGQSLPFDATWSDVMIKVNGIWLGYGAPEATTWAEKADQVEARLDTFSHRWLSLPGKVTVVNRFIVPLLWYPGTVIAAPDHALVRLERIIFDFIWGKRKPNLVKRTVLYQTPLSGGLGLVHLPSKLRFFLLKGVFVAFENPSFPFAFFVRYWGGFLFRHHWPGSFSNNRPKATRPSGVYTQIGDSLRRIKEEGGPHVLLNVAPLCYTHHCFVQCSRLCARRLAGPPSLQMCGGLCVASH
ncbi:pol-like protein [Apostichopus japonicus]|uniref:Pol-like protein n=1 Tax=Stichopus japonicus TaxID=307972 RepID=A0A2G8KEN8_STIJA|nr:pol-like protein [Apostichopus japonicus]